MSKNDTTPAELSEFLITIWIKQTKQEWDKARQEMIENLASGIKAANAMEWAAEFTRIAITAGMVERIEHAVDKGEGTLLEVAGRLAEELTSDMLNNRFSPNSTSHFHNATMLARADACLGVRRRLASAIKGHS